MTIRSRHARRRLITQAIGLGIVATIALAGCSTGSPAGGGSTPQAVKQVATQANITAALQKKTTITFWAWGPQYADVVKAFEAAYPKVTVNLQNNGSNGAEYTKLQNVVKAGSGIPDVAQIEYTALPQFAFGKSLVDLSGYGVASMKSKYSGSTWNQVNVNGGIYGLPQDAGPMAMFYRKDLFDKYGLTVPTTWDEYIADAKKLHAADPTKFIGADSGSASFANAMIWQAGGKPYATKGTNVSVNLSDTATSAWAKTWDQLIDGGLLSPDAGFSPEWTAGLGSGKYATWLGGAWAAGTLQNRIPSTSGDWRVAPMPQYKADDNANSEQGGSSSAVMAASTNKLASIGFVQWMSANPAANKIWVDEGGFPSTTSVLDSSDWINKPIPYFGGQAINKVFSQSTKAVLPGWQFLPFELYADSIFSDSVGQSYANKTPLADGLKAWQKTIVSYGNGQGFTVNK
jgi:multiple sugar transport system substrate-binding protein